MGSMNQGGAPNQGGFSQQAPASSGLQQNVAAALCYLLGILGAIVFLVLEPYNKDRLIRFHAFQSLFLWLGFVAFSIVASIVLTILGFIPFVNIIAGILAIILWIVLLLAGFGLWIFMSYKAYSNERVVLPIIGPLAEKQA